MTIEPIRKDVNNIKDKINECNNKKIIYVTDIVAGIAKARNADLAGNHELADQIRTDLHKAMAEQSKRFTPEQIETMKRAHEKILLEEKTTRSFWQ